MMRAGRIDQFDSIRKGRGVIVPGKSFNGAKRASCGLIRPWCGGIVLFLGLITSSFALGPAWVEQGFSPSEDGNPVIPLQNDPVVGAVSAVLPHPTDPLTLYVAGVGGGIWKTINGGTTWTPQTDGQSSLAINWLAFDPTDATFNTVVAGVGRNSSFVLDREGGQLTGILRTTNGGTAWTSLGFNELRDRNIFGVEARGNTVLVAAWNHPRTGGTGAGL